MTWKRNMIFFMMVFFIFGMMSVPAFADSGSETNTCKQSHVSVERTNGKIVCMTERTAERTVERFGWIILNDILETSNKATISDTASVQDDLTITTKQSASNDPDSIPSGKTVKPKQTKHLNEEKATMCINDTCVDLLPGEEVSVEVELPVGRHKTADGKYVTEKELQTVIFASDAVQYVAPEDCTPTEGVMEWGALYQGSKILEDLQNVIDSGETRLCVTIFADVTVGGFDDYQFQYESRTNLYEFLVQQGADVEGHIGPGGIKKISGRTSETIDAAIPLSLLDEIANRDDVINIDVLGKNTSTPYHIRMGQDSKLGPVLQKEIERKQQTCTYENDFPDECPPLEKNADGKYVVNIDLLLDIPTYEDLKSEIYSRGELPHHQDRVIELTRPMLDELERRGGVPHFMDRDREWTKQLFDELERQNAIAKKPMLDLLAENNIEASPSRYIPYISATVPIDLLSQLVNHDLVDYISTDNTFGHITGWINPEDCEDCGRLVYSLQLCQGWCP